MRLQRISDMDNFIHFYFLMYLLRCFLKNNDSIFKLDLSLENI